MSNDVTHEPGADELRMRRLLRERGVGPDAVAPPPARPRDWLDDIVDSAAIPAAEPKQPPAPRKDWWGPLYQDDRSDLDTFTGNTPAPLMPPRPGYAPDVPAAEDDDPDQTDDDSEEAAVAPAKARQWPMRKAGQDDGKRPAKAPKKPHPAAPNAPRQSLLEALDRVPRRVRQLAYHASAAGAGWWLGWVDWGTDTAAWYAAGHWTTPSAWVLYGLGLCACTLYRRSRNWAWPAAWAAAIPISSVVAGVLLYGTGYPS